METIKQYLLLKYPLFGNIIANTEIIYQNDNIPAPSYTDGISIYYNDNLLNNYKEQDQVFIIAHEIFHIALRHLFRNQGKDIDLMNFVADGIINQLLKKDGFEIPKGSVIIEDALDYSVEELYMKYLSNITFIKKWMISHTYHLNLQERADWASNDSIEELMNENNKIKDSILSDIREEMKRDAQYGNGTKSTEIDAEKLGHAKKKIPWQAILKQNLKSQNKNKTLYLEAEPDGILRKENTSDDHFSESKIIIDSSGSMFIEKIRAILRECKSILKNGKISVGFCDTKFYGWHNIVSMNDIDKLKITGRGGTDFYEMANQLKGKCDNKIVITDGYGEYPLNRDDILWIIVNFSLPTYYEYELKRINYIFIDEKDIVVPKQYTKK